MSTADWRMRAANWRPARLDRDLRLREAPGHGASRDGRHQSSARLRGGRRNPRRRRQCRRCGGRRAVRAHRGRADDGRPARRRHRAYPPARRAPHRDRGDEHRAARGPARHVPSALRSAARSSGGRRPREHDRPEGDGDARQSRRLVRGARALRHAAARGGDGAGDPARGGRVPHHRLSRPSASPRPPPTLPSIPRSPRASCPAARRSRRARCSPSRTTPRRCG